MRSSATPRVSSGVELTLHLPPVQLSLAQSEREQKIAPAAQNGAGAPTTVCIMAFRRRKQKGGGRAVEIVAHGPGLIVQGQPLAVTAFIDHVTSLTNDSVGRTHQLAADGLAVAGHLDAKRRNGSRAASISSSRRAHTSFCEHTGRSRVKTATSIASSDRVTGLPAISIGSRPISLPSRHWRFRMQPSISLYEPRSRI